MAFADIPQPKNVDERLALARRACEEFELPQDFWIDGLDDQSRALFGDLPSPALILGPDGTVAAKLPWSEPDILRSRLEAHLAAVAAAFQDADAPPQLSEALWRARRGEPDQLLASKRPDTSEDTAVWALARAQHAAQETLPETVATLEKACATHSERLAAALADVATGPLGADPCETSHALLRRIVELAGDERPRQAAWARARMRDEGPL
jgi:hypothetical protein